MSSVDLTARCAGDVGQSAAGVLELNGGVMDRETLLEYAVDVPQNRLAGRGRDVFDQHMAAQRALLRPQIPYVQIVHIDHAGDALNSGGDFGQPQAFGQPFQQNVERVLEDIPGGPYNHQRDHDREDRIDLQPAGVVDDHGAEDDADAAGGIAHLVNPGRAKVEVAIVAMAVAADAPGNRQIHQNAEGGDPQHDLFRHRFGVQQAPVAFPQQGAREDHQ